MFDKNFYPTPNEVISKMVEGINFEFARVLEPSAGKGNILDYILENKYKYTRRDIKDQLFTIEKNKELQFILKEKGYKVIADDFLEYNSDYLFDVIVMNPPFNNGAKHLLKAWEISKGADIRCLLNAETIKNPYSKERQILLEIIKQNNGEVIELGRCFADSERTTNVEVVLIKLKDNAYESEFEFKGKKEVQGDLDIPDLSNQIQTKDTFGNMEMRYNKVKDLIKELIKVQNEIEFYSDGLIDSMYNGIDRMIKESMNGNSNIYYNSFMERFRVQCWNSLFNKTKMAYLTTKKVRQDFYKMQEQQGYMAFTKENMIEIYEQLFYSTEHIMTKCIEEAFDLMTKYYKENRVYVEGWKTNDQWRVNSKVILPNMRDNWEDKKPKLNYSSKETLQDIEKACCFILKRNFDSIKHIEDVFNKDEVLFGQWGDSEFFRAKLYKKGTLHIEFKDKYLHEQFNIIACKNKNWLGY